MRWEGRRGSDNIEDRRGSAPRKMIGGGIGTIAIVLVYWMLGGNPGDALKILQQPDTDQTQVSNYEPTEEENRLKEFARVVLADTEEVWSEIFKENNRKYDVPFLVLYTNGVETACGSATSETGPFYCPGDEKVYLDLSFCKELSEKFKAPGDFAMAYVIAHEVGHHIQKLLGTTEKMNEMRARLSEKEYNKLSVRLELQADFYAGVWANHDQKLHNVLEEGDIDEALNAASAVGDDRIQKSMQGYVVPDAFTHGTSEQRKKWFYKGFTTGDINQGNTFSDRNL